MNRMTFFEWLQNTNESRIARYGGSEDDEKTPFNMLSRIRDNEIAEGDDVAAFQDACFRWAKSAPGPAKEMLKAKVDELYMKLLQQGNSMNRVQSIMNQAIGNQMSQLVKTAQRSSGIVTRV